MSSGARASRVGQGQGKGKGKVFRPCSIRANVVVAGTFGVF